jgi:la-related protein 1
MAPMSAVPFQPAPYWDNMVMTMLKQQIEYYFSIDNLCKDLFLRQRMDSQGFVPLHFVLAFQRIRDMQAELAMVRAVCEESNEIDYVVGEDDCERLRRRHGWETFVLPMEDRDAGARNHGPMHPSFKSRSYNMGSPFNGMGSPPMHFPMGSPHGYSAPPEQAFQPFSNGPLGLPNGQEPLNGKRSNSNGASQLSAAVPDFSPSGSFIAGDQSVGALNGDVSGKVNGTATTNGHVENGHTNGVVNGVHGAEQAQEASQA